jgi:hypothetical protein
MPVISDSRQGAHHHPAVAGPHHKLGGQVDAELFAEVLQDRVDEIDVAVAGGPAALRVLVVAET